MSGSVDGLLGGSVECDEIYIGGKPRYKSNKRGCRTPKPAVVAMVERQGRVKTRPVADVTARTLKEAIRQNVAPTARILTDEHASYVGIGRPFDGGHHTVRHSFGEYVRGDIHTNTVEGFFSIVRRGLTGIYHRVSKEHLHRYLSEFEFRYNFRELEDGERTVRAIQMAEGKRLMYSDAVVR
jgi:transposase-like protein